eukprot:2940384-Rhodomonas_salina.1
MGFSGPGTVLGLDALSSDACLERGAAPIPLCFFVSPTARNPPPCNTAASFAAKKEVKRVLPCRSGSMSRGCRSTCLLSWSARLPSPSWQQQVTRPQEARGFPLPSSRPPSLPSLTSESSYLLSDRAAAVNGEAAGLLTGAIGGGLALA